ncbi:hypothetical protein [Proteus mirabilis]|uniref:hypothetical protein n=1 Tax=Proteus mirabilis TaxID=584 RepID=UPI0034D598D8
MDSKELYSFLTEDVNESGLLTEAFRPWESIKVAYAGKSESLIRDLEKEVKEADSKGKLKGLIGDVNRYLSDAEIKYQRLKDGKILPNETSLFDTNVSNSIVGIVFHKNNFKDGSLKKFINDLKRIKSEGERRIKTLK